MMKSRSLTTALAGSLTLILVLTSVAVAARPIPPPPIVPTPPATMKFARLDGSRYTRLYAAPRSTVKLARLPHGAVVGVLKRSAGGAWLRVRYLERVGWIRADETKMVKLTGLGLAVKFNRVIVVSLAQQQLEAYEDGRLVLISAITSGQPALATPTGTSRVKSKTSPFRFRSPWPKSSRWWYAPVWSNWAARFRGGYFLHDAPWRPAYAFGWGTNVAHRDPDGIRRTGSHGCVNVPRPTMRRLYAWLRVGDMVVVR